MRIAIVRGPNLNPFEMQSYLPLAQEHRLFGFATPDAPLRESDARMAVTLLRSPAQLVAKAPARCRRVVYQLLSHGLGPARDWMFGLEKRLRGMDIIHTAETFNGYSLQALRAKRKWGGTLIVTCWETIPFNFERGPLGRYVKARLRAEADHFIAVTGKARDCLRAEGVELDRISVIPVGVELNRFRPGEGDKALAGEMGLRPGVPTILFVGRLVQEKGVYDLLRALHLLQGDFGLQADLLMVGEGRERARLMREAKRLGIEASVQIRPALSYARMAEVYRLADIFVLPSKPTRVWEEQFGMVLVEAMASGVPLVATDCGAIAEVVGEAGLVVPPASPDKLADALVKLLQTPELRNKLGEAGNLRAQRRFSHIEISRRIAETYRLVAGGRGRTIDELRPVQQEPQPLTGARR